jgi:hypothetical protein
MDTFKSSNTPSLAAPPTYRMQTESLIKEVSELGNLFFGHSKFVESEQKSFVRDYEPRVEMENISLLKLSEQSKELGFLNTQQYVDDHFQKSHSKSCFVFGINIVVLDSVRVIKKHLENEEIQTEKRQHAKQQREESDTKLLLDIKLKHQQVRDSLQKQIPQTSNL